MTTDVHQQRQKSRPAYGRRHCMNCGVVLWEGEVARHFDGGFIRADVCINCDVNGSPRRPAGAPTQV